MVAANGKEAMKNILTRAGVAIVLAAGLGFGTTSGASADPVPEWDHVYATVSGNSISGDIYWSSYQVGRGSITIRNDMTDGVCATGQQRVMKGGVWSAWNTIAIVCTVPSYTANVGIPRSLGAVQYYQFRVADARSDWAYDTISPGGA